MDYKNKNEHCQRKMHTFYLGQRYKGTYFYAWRLINEDEMIIKINKINGWKLGVSFSLFSWFIT